MIGWKELAGIVDKARFSLGDEEWMQTLIICDNYGQAGAINYYADTYLAAVSMNADYQNWFPGKEKIIRTVILVQSAKKQSPNIYSQYFQSIDSVGVIGNKMAREYGTTVFLLRNAHKVWDGDSFKKWISE